MAIYIAERVGKRTRASAVRLDEGSRIVTLPQPQRRTTKPNATMPGGAVILPFAPRTRPTADLTEPPALTGSR